MDLRKVYLSSTLLSRGREVEYSIYAPCSCRVLRDLSSVSRPTRPTRSLAQLCLNERGASIKGEVLRTYLSVLSTWQLKPHLAIQIKIRMRIKILFQGNFNMSRRSYFLEKLPRFQDTFLLQAPPHEQVLSCRYREGLTLW